MAQTVESRHTDLNNLITHNESKTTNLKFMNGKANGISNGYNKPPVHDTVIKTETKYTGLPPLMDWSQFEDVAPCESVYSSLLTALLTHLGLYILMILGFVNQLLFTPKVATEKNREGYAPLYDPFEQFYSRYVYRRVRHCFNQPICSAPSAEITIMSRHSDDHNWSFRLTGGKEHCINLGSYNYLGLGAATGARSDVTAAVRSYGLASSSSCAELGTTPPQRRLERAIASFLGTEDAIAFGMGFATNALSLPALLGPRSLALSDEKNHASLILGLRLARATVQVFRHNDLRHLEQLARRALLQRRYDRIVIVVEGVYSMEGSVAPIRALVALKQHLGLALYVDEAHSVGAVGPGGRGALALHGVHPSEIDVLMGTFTKSFGAAGGYIAGSAALVNAIRASGHAHTYAGAMAPCVAAQAEWALRQLEGEKGEMLTRRLRRRTRQFRRRLAQMRARTLGAAASPVVPVLVYTFSKMAATVERLRARGFAVVGVGFPATPLNEARIRFCLSAGLSRRQVDECADAMEAVVKELGLQYGPAFAAPAPPDVDTDTGTNTDSDTDIHTEM
ncbi:hypothetical protein ACJJTC_015107 [Scirpophaga incertulas]